MPPDMSADLKTNTDEFLKAYTRAGNLADTQGLLLFSAVPKLHWMWHMAVRSAFLHPRRSACFIDEDFVKHMKQIAARCVSGTKQHLVPTKLLMKYRWGMGMQR